MSKIVPLLLLSFFLYLGISRMLYKNWNVLRHFGIHKFEIGDCVVHAKDKEYPYKIFAMFKNQYAAQNIRSPKFATSIKYGHWEEDFWEKVDCP